MTLSMHRTCLEQFGIQNNYGQMCISVTLVWNNGSVFLEGSKVVLLSQFSIGL